jgi:hypothetical protein
VALSGIGFAGVIVSADPSACGVGDCIAALGVSVTKTPITSTAATATVKSADAGDARQVTWQAATPTNSGPQRRGDRPGVAALLDRCDDVAVQLRQQRRHATELADGLAARRAGAWVCLVRYLLSCERLSVPGVNA